MATSKQINVVLSLDDAGFSVKTKSAAELTKLLNTGFETIGKTVGNLETTIAGLTKGIGSILPAFASVEKTLKSVVEQMGETAGGATKAAAGLKTMRDGTTELDAKLRLLGFSVRGAGEEINRAAGSMAQMKPSLAAAAGGYKNLDLAMSGNAKIAKESATASIDARLKTLQNEIKSNEETIASRAKMYEELRVLESNQRAFAANAKARGEDAIRRLGAYGGQNVIRASDSEAARHTATADVARGELAALDQLIPKMREEQAARRANITALEQERAAALLTVDAKKNAAVVGAALARDIASDGKRIESERAAAERAAAQQTRTLARETAAERKRLDTEVADHEKEQARMIAGMWKAMAQGYSGAKIEKGLGVSVGAADQMERQKIMVGALNLPQGQENALFASSKEMAGQLKFISNLDAIKSRMSAIASIGYDNAPLIDKTLGTAIKTANNLEYLQVAQGDLQTTIRNLYGVVEMRQQTADPEGTKRTFELMQKIITGTAGKVQTADMETVLRRIGFGASQMGDDGMVKIAALVDQFKVAGGDHGGGGGGVSVVGTMLKMFQSYALGKGLSGEAVKEFSGADILKTSGLDLSKDKAGVFKDAKHAGLKNAELWLKDPVAAMQSIMPQIIAYTQQAKNKGQFYEGRDMNNSENQMIAVSQYLSRLGITTTAQQGFITAAAPASKERIAHQAETIKNSKGVDEVDAMQKETFGRNVQEVKATLSDIAVLVGNSLLPPLKEVLGVVKSILGGFREFATENPLATQFLAIGAAVGGLVLSASGFLNLFGMGGITGAITSFGAVATKIFPTFIGWFTSLGGVIEGVLPMFGAFVAQLFAWLASGAMLALAGLVGWIIGRWVSSIQVGGLEIGQHFENMFNSIGGWWDKTINTLTSKWIEFKHAIGLTSDVQYAAESAENKAEAKKNADIHAMSENKPTGGGTGMRMDASTDSRSLGSVKGIKDENASTLADMAKDQSIAKALAEANKNTATNKLLAGGGEGNDGSNRPDPLNKAIQELIGKNKANKIKLESLIVGKEEVANLYAEAAAEVEGKREAGDYNTGKKRDIKPEKGSDKIVELAKQLGQEKLQAEQIKAMEFGQQRLAAASLEAGDAMERLTGNNATKASDSFRALSRELERAEVRLGAGAKAFDKWQLAKNEALFERSRADLGNLSADQKEKNTADVHSYLPTAALRTAADLDATNQKANDLYRQRLDQVEIGRQQTIAAANAVAVADQQRGLSQESVELRTADRIKRINKEANDAILTAGEIHTQALVLQAEKRQRALEQPVMGLARQWKDTEANISADQTKWADGFVSMLTNTLSTGKMDFSGFVKSILMDIATVELKSKLADPLKTVISSGTDYLNTHLFNRGQATADAAGNPDASAGNIRSLDNAAEKAAASLADMKGGVGDATMAAAKAALVDASQSSATEVFTSSITSATVALGEFIAVLGAKSGGSLLGGLSGASGSGPGAQGVWAGSGGADMSSIGNMGAASIVPGFALGGIMTNNGPVSLRKYAGGGVANSPQLALYGEAGPEAYVPLPDGRTIPVTMQGGAGGGQPNVTVNVINQSGGAVSAQQGQPRFDGASMILDVVLTAANSPGGFRDGMKGALK